MEKRYLVEWVYDGDPCTLECDSFDSARRTYRRYEMDIYAPWYISMQVRSGEREEWQTVQKFECQQANPPVRRECSHPYVVIVKNSRGWADACAGDAFSDELFFAWEMLDEIAPGSLFFGAMDNDDGYTYGAVHCRTREDAERVLASLTDGSFDWSPANAVGEEWVAEYFDIAQINERGEIPPEYAIETLEVCPGAGVSA